MYKLVTAAAAVLLAAGLTACGEGSTSAAPTGCTPKVTDDHLITAGTLTYATNATLPPMQYVDQGKVTGMRVDMANQIANDLCLKATVVNVPFDAQIPGVQGNRWDMINTGMFYTAARAETIALVPYEVQGVAVSVSEGNPKNINTEADLSGKVIAVEAPGYEFDTLNELNDSFAKAGKAPITLRTFQTNADAYQALSAKQVDGAAIVEAVTSYYQQGGRFQTAVHGLNTAPLALGFAKDNSVLADAVAAELTQLKASGWLDNLFAKYSVTPFNGKIALTTGALATGS